MVWVPHALTVKGHGASTTPAGKRIDHVTTAHAVVLAGVDRNGV